MWIDADAVVIDDTVRVEGKCFRNILFHCLADYRSPIFISLGGKLKNKLFDCYPSIHLTAHSILPF